MPYTLRNLTHADVDEVCRHRMRMFSEAGTSAETLASMMPGFRAWLAPRLDDGRYFGFAAEHEGEVVAAVGLMAIDWPPHPQHPSDDRRGYVLNMFVEPEHRSRGLARRLMDAADEEFRRRGIGYAILHSTTAGRPVYERAGWSATTEMAKRL